MVPHDMITEEVERRCVGCSLLPVNSVVTHMLPGAHRQLVVEAFQRRRPHWRATAETGCGESLAPDASTSDLHWGEYERMDWARIHEGGHHSHLQHSSAEPGAISCTHAPTLQYDLVRTAVV